MTHVTGKHRVQSPKTLLYMLATAAPDSTFPIRISARAAELIEQRALNKGSEYPQRPWGTGKEITLPLPVFKSLVMHLQGDESFSRMIERRLAA